MDDTYIKNIFKEYNDIYFKIPEIQQYIEIHNNIIACRFNTIDLYNKKYILEINDNLNESDSSKAILFHEFTHVYDSLQLLKYPFEDYIKLMYIYSEVHASEIEMNVYLNIENFFYEKFMKLSLRNLIENFTLPDGPIIKGQLGFDERLLYYYIGYIVSLRKHNIEYDYVYNYIQKEFQDMFISITDYFIQDVIYNYNDLLLYQNNLHNLIKDTLKNHQEKYK